MRYLLLVVLLAPSAAVAAELPLPLDPSSIATFGAWSTGEPFVGGPGSCAIAVRADHLSFEVAVSLSTPADVTLAVEGTE